MRLHLESYSGRTKIGTLNPKECGFLGEKDSIRLLNNNGNLVSVDMMSSDVFSISF